MNALTPADLLNTLRQHLAPWVAEHKGRLSLAKDPYHVIEILSEAPAGFRVILHWTGDEQLGDLPQQPLCTHQVDVILSFNLGLTAEPSAALVEARNNRPPLYGLLNDLRRRVLGCNYAPDISAEYLMYRGTEPVVMPEGLPLAAYRIQFSLDAALPEPTYVN